MNTKVHTARTAPGVCRAAYPAARCCAAGVAGLAAPLGMLGSRVLAANTAPRTFKIAWSQTAVCQSPVSVALGAAFRQVRPARRAHQLQRLDRSAA